MTYTMLSAICTNVDGGDSDVVGGARGGVSSVWSEADIVGGHWLQACQPEEYTNIVLTRYHAHTLPKPAVIHVYVHAHVHVHVYMYMYVITAVLLIAA